MKKMRMTNPETTRSVRPPWTRRLPKYDGRVMALPYCSVNRRSRGATSFQFAQAPRVSPIAIHAWTIPPR